MAFTPSEFQQLQKINATQIAGFGTLARTMVEICFPEACERLKHELPIRAERMRDRNDVESPQAALLARRNATGGNVR